jgi:hypothetical protein
MLHIHILDQFDLASCIVVAVESIVAGHSVCVLCECSGLAADGVVFSARGERGISALWLTEIS